MNCRGVVKSNPPPAPPDAAAAATAPPWEAVVMLANDMCDCSFMSIGEVAIQESPSIVPCSRRGPLAAPSELGRLELEMEGGEEGEEEEEEADLRALRPAAGKDRRWLKSAALLFLLLTPRDRRWWCWCLC